MQRILKLIKIKIKFMRCKLKLIYYLNNNKVFAINYKLLLLIN